MLTAWLKGAEVDWSRLYDSPRQRVHLPAYPFAGKRYWLPEITASKPTAKHDCHPLLQQNISDLSAYAFQTCLTGAEFFLAQHQINQQNVLPGAVYLEMVSAAIRQLLPAAESLIVIKDLVWLKPFIVDDTERLLQLRLQANGEQRF
ncbi:polyketide synthase dehydratase domain-containing protein [Methylocucumis oryzae]|uniref:PKS/mFAS DH domain-containing protein n=1 Tax=Methylocucumis oryzae TaxID=1632867 RepID=A0A0F3IIX6_9GAMM|nr:polyketide synthase dehydratase domain-containing protein [Methylocucumis oryzae]KJV06715.1 hypothetical protein VZ94_09435 [Methylocucumis oryzae]